MDSRLLSESENIQRVTSEFEPDRQGISLVLDSSGLERDLLSGAGMARDGAALRI